MEEFRAAMTQRPTNRQISAAFFITAGVGTVQASCLKHHMFKYGRSVFDLVASEAVNRSSSTVIE